MKLIYNNKEVANNTKNYNELLNKPLLNSKELIGNISLNDINVYNKKEVDNLIASTRSVKAVTALPSPLVENTMYYVGPDADNNYHVYLVDSALTLIDLGMAREESMYKAGAGIEIDSSNNIMADLDYKSVSLDSEGKIYARSATADAEGIVSYDNDSIKKNNSGKLYVPTTKSGDRFGVYPYIDNIGNMSIGKSIGFYTSDTDTGWKGVLQWDDVKRKLYLGDYTQSTPSITVIPSGEATVGSAIQPVYVNDGIITKAYSSFIPQGATIIPDNSNLNTTAFTACGEYLCGGNASAATLTNCPTTSGFRMFVENVVSSNAGSLSATGGWVSRTRYIENFGGAIWVQGIVKEGASDTTIVYGPWRQIIDSGVAQRWMPFRISDSNIGSFINRSDIKDPNGNTYSVITTGQKCVDLVGNMSNVTSVNMKVAMMYSGGNNTMWLGRLERNQPVKIKVSGQNGTNAYNTILDLTSSSGTSAAENVSFNLFGGSISVNELSYEMRWTRFNGQWWYGEGRISYPNLAYSANLSIRAKAYDLNSIPRLEFYSTGALQAYTYDIEINHKTF